MTDRANTIDWQDILTKIESLVTERLKDIAIEEDVDIHHNYTVYGSPRGLSIQIQVAVRPKENT